MALLGDLLIRIRVDNAGASDTLTDTQERLQRTAASATTLGQQMQNMGKQLSHVGSSLTKSITLPILAIGAAAIKFSTDLNAAMANVATLIPNSAKRVDELKKSVQSLSMAMGKSSIDIAGGLYQVISAFGDTADTVAILKTNVMAAAAGLSTTTEAINLTSAVTKGYGEVTAETVKKASDLAFITVKLGQTTFPDLAASMGAVVPMASQLKVSQEELFAGYATLTGVTGGAAEVTTQLRAILAGMVKPTEAMEASIKALGYTSTATMVQERGMVGALRALLATTDGSAEAVTKLFMRVESLPAVFALTSGQADVFDDKLGALQNAAGATEEAFREQSDGINKLGFAIERTKQMVINLAQNLGDALAPALQNVLDRIQPLFEKISIGLENFKTLDSNIQANILSFVGLAAATGPILIVLGSLMSAVGKIGPIFAALASPIGLAATAIIATTVAIGAAIKNLWGTNQEFRNKVISAWQQVQALFAETSNVIKNVLGKLRDAFLKAGPEIQSTFIKAFSAIVDGGLALWRSFNTYLLPGIQKFATWVISRIPDVMHVFNVVFNAMLDVAVNTFTWLDRNVFPILGGIIKWVELNWPNIAMIFQNVWDIAVALTQWAITEIKKIGPEFQVFGDNVKRIAEGFSEKFWEAVTSVGNAVTQIIANIAAATNAVKNFMISIGVMAKTMPEISSPFVGSWGGESTDKKIKGLTDNFKDLTKGAGDVTKGLKDIPKVLDNVGSGAKNAAKGIDAAKEALERLDRIGNALTTALKNRYSQQLTMLKKNLETAVNAQKEATEKTLALLEKEYNARIRNIDIATANKVASIQAQIDAIENLTSAEDEQAKKASVAEQKAALQAEILSATTADEKLRLKKELNTLIADEDRRLLLLQRDQQITALNEEIARVQEAATKQKDVAQQQYDNDREREERSLSAKLKWFDKIEAETEEHFARLMSEEQLNQEARKTLVQKTQDDILQLLDTYNSDWRNAGKSFGEQFADGLKSSLSKINDILNSIKPVSAGSRSSGGGGGSVSVSAKGGGSFKASSLKLAPSNAYTITATAGKALGGFVRRNKSYVVGETGRELFTPETNGTITPNGALNRGAAAGKVDLNINLSVDGTADMRRLADELGPELVRILKQHFVGMD